MPSDLIQYPGFHYSHQAVKTGSLNRHNLAPEMGNNGQNDSALQGPKEEGP
jgi:hypothetical protein